jgi:drug/metabolite transporter (DMT)-like permease
LASQGAALLAMLVVAAATGAFGDPTGYLGWAIGAAVVGVIALTGFYAALAEGTMGVVAPVASLGVVVPVIVGISEGDRPTLWQGLGVALAVVGVVLASGPELRGDRPGGARPLFLAGVAAVGFGLAIVFLVHGARSSTTMTLLTMRATTVAVLGPLAVAGKVRVGATARDLPILVAVGAGDLTANAALSVASTRGLLSVVAVLSSLYPAVTVLLARAVHDERLGRLQTIGVTAAMVGVVLIASGGGA